MKTCSKCGYVGNNFPPSRGSQCRDCKNAYRREWGNRNPDKNRQYKQTWVDRNLSADRAKHLKRKYGLSEEDYAVLLAAQGGVCGICGGDETCVRRSKSGAEAFAVDHDHETGRIRGLLCTRCNTAIGSLGDTAEGLRKALAYLEGVRA